MTRIEIDFKLYEFNVLSSILLEYYKHSAFHYNKIVHQDSVEYDEFFLRITPIQEKQITLRSEIKHYFKNKKIVNKETKETAMISDSYESNSKFYFKINYSGENKIAAFFWINYIQEVWDY